MTFYPLALPRSSVIGERRTQRGGTALIMVLAAVVLVSLLLISLMSWSTTYRQMSASSLRQIQGEFLAETAIETITGDLLDEIATGSALVNNVAGVAPYFRPNTVGNLIPSRSPASSPFINLIKVSRGGEQAWVKSGTATFSSTGLVRAATNPTDTPSYNRRRIPNERWNEGMLIDSSVFGQWRAPDWILITRQGAMKNANALPSLAQLADSSASNNNYVLGRFAYAIYDEGGMLDVNVAGNALTTLQNRERGRLHQAALSVIPGLTNPTALVNWRWPVSGASMSFDPGSNGLFDPTRPFDQVVVVSGNNAQTDQIFLSRKDLIRYQQDNTSVLSTAALPYLGTFSRELNAPSAPEQGTKPTINSDFVSLRWSRDRVLPDGTNVKKGTPLVFRRFSLYRLAQVSDSATSGSSDTSDAIYRQFGLSRASATNPWVYNHGVANRIYNLSEIETLGREPDFFELLKAAILNGSLGKTGNYHLGGVLATDANTDFQIIQIGANLIDQADADSYPTPITLGTLTAYGIENLPYLYSLNSFYYRLLPGPGNIDNTATRDRISNWLAPVLWNPHQAPLSSTPNLNLRVVATKGTMEAFVLASRSTWAVRYGYAGRVNFALTPSIITFPNRATTFRDPQLLTPTDGAASPAASNSLVTPALNIIGFFAGAVTAPDKTLNPTGANADIWCAAQPFFISTAATPDPVSVELQYYSNNAWRTYQRLDALASDAGLARDPYASPILINPPLNFLDAPQLLAVLRKCDPRTGRFGMFADNLGVAITGNSLRPTQSPTDFGRESKYNPFEVTTGVKARMGALAENLPTSPTFYADPDGVTRPGDAAYGSYPQAEGAQKDLPARPVILDRPFRSVGEMGYAFRDLPWKTLDFSSDKSADARLLDVFSVDENRVITGKVNLNTRNATVLKAILAGVGLTLGDGSTTSLSTSDAETLANYIVNNGPYNNLGEVQAKLATAPGSYPVTAGGYSRLKPQREAAIRALASSTQTRTWNLLIDLICQRGRYPASPPQTDLNKFIVEGENHYWIHIAIDRYTGQVIAKVIERAYE